MKTRYIKVIRDLSSDYRRIIMLAVAIGIGLFGIGTILGTYSLVGREMTSNYMSTVPASATIEIRGNLDKTLLDSVRRFPGIAKAERRATIVGRMNVEDRWYPILLFVIDDFTKMEISKPNHLSGSKDPATGTMLVERTALTMMKASEGDHVIVRTPNGTSHPLTISGVVHDPGLAPAWQEQAGYAYITMATLKGLGETGQGFDQLRILVSENEFSSTAIGAVAKQLSDWLTAKGNTVHEIQIPPPGRHPHQGQMQAVLEMFVLFSYLTLILGSILVATSVATIMVKQVRQIGVMKTIGSTSWQIARMYLLTIGAVCLLSLIVFVPLSWIAARLFSNQIAVLLNLELNDRSIPLWVPLIQVASGFIIPVLITFIPVIRGSMITIRKALDNHGASRTKKAVFVARFGFMSDTYRLAFRNAFRQRWRLVLTLGLLAVGGAMFMTASNISEAWDKTLSLIYVQRLYDQQIKLNERTDGDSLIAAISKIEGVKTVEGWDYSATSSVSDSEYEVTRTYPDKGHGSFTMMALPVRTQMLNPMVVEGTWLLDENAFDVVLNQGARAAKIGDSIALTIEGEASKWRVVGFTRDVGSGALAYVSKQAFALRNGTTGKVKELRISYTNRSSKFVNETGREVERIIESRGVGVSSTIPVWLLHNAVAGHMRVLVNSLTTMGILMVIVGAIGLLSTISMNVIERTREIGVMRAIGATPKKIRSLIVWEGLTIGAFSLVLAFGLSLILSYYIGNFIGHMSFNLPLPLTISLTAFAIWILIIVAGSYGASAIPARRANKITTREALSYE